MALLLTRLQVRRAQMGTLLRWYEITLGMSQLRRFDGGVWVGFPDQPRSAVVELMAADDDRSYVSGQQDIYWKIGISMADVDAGRKRLVDKGEHVSKPNQFRDIGYLCHMADPSGYCIELLQHQFEKNFSPTYAASLAAPEKPLGQKAIIGQITLRVADAERSLRFYTETLGMKLLSRQRVHDMFDLYFLADTSETPPSSDVDAVENREWLWQREFTTLELQHHANRAPTSFQMPPKDQLGFRGIGVKVPVERFQELEQQQQQHNSLEQEHPMYSERVLSIKDPDGTPILVFCA